jgi:endonuclease/exonuclease/phosphatase family metal-dependent hydrolase
MWASHDFATEVTRSQPNGSRRSPVKYVVRLIIAMFVAQGAAVHAASAQEIVLQPANATTVMGAWKKVVDPTAAGGARLEMPEKGAAKITTALASPSDYFELSFNATAGVPYRLWLRGKATKDSYNADSVHIQFDEAVTATGGAAFRIGTTAATAVTIEDCSGCGVKGWGWNDNYYGSKVGSLVYFAATGLHTIRVQNREDGLAIDQIVLSPALYMTAAPGANKNDTILLDTATGTPQAQTKASAPAAPPAPSAPTTTTLRVMHWNTHHGGYGTDNKYDTDRLASWIAKENPDVVSLNEIEKKTGWGNEDQPAKYKALLEQKTGHPWYMVWAQEYGQWDAAGKGNLILSRYPWTSSTRYLLNHTRTVALGQIVVNGRNITFASTHLDPDSGSYRLKQAQELLPWETNFAENRILVGDMNAQPTSSEMAVVKKTYADAWSTAKAGGFAHSSSDNPNGYTRHSRIDYVFTSAQAANLKLIRVEVVDVRDAKGVMPSDHRPIVVDYAVN